MTADIQLTDDEISRIAANKPVSKDCFYVLIIGHNWRGQEPDMLMFTAEVRDNIPICSNVGYASKLTNGELLEDAVRRDLQDDFLYAGDFRVLGAEKRDTARNKKGQSLTRLTVWIEVANTFATDRLNTLGMDPHWHKSSD